MRIRQKCLSTRSALPCQTRITHSTSGDLLKPSDDATKTIHDSKQVNDLLRSVAQLVQHKD
ncbi:MAG: hypothetical protein P4L46_20055 [Fimbriimonas sp.]|nr:hypothetical protein [Fimbriimonas sp.]